MAKVYVAYGSNLNMEQMRDRCPTAEFIGTGAIENYELQFKGSLHNAHATIAPKEGSSALVGVWRIQKRDESHLDMYEGYNPKGYCQDTIFGGFAPNSQTANTLSGNLGSRTVLSGTVTKGKNDDSQSLQMMERPLMSPDELKSMPKGSFVVMKTGTHPMKTKLKLFFDWGIQFQKPLEMPDRGSRPVYYAGKQDLERSILFQFPMIHMPMGATMPSRVQQASKPMPTTININNEDE